MRRILLSIIFNPISLAFLFLTIAEFVPQPYKKTFALITIPLGIFLFFIISYLWQSHQNKVEKQKRIKQDIEYKLKEIERKKEEQQRIKHFEEIEERTKNILLKKIKEAKIKNLVFIPTGFLSCKKFNKTPFKKKKFIYNKEKKRIKKKSEIILSNDFILASNGNIKFSLQLYDLIDKGYYHCIKKKSDIEEISITNINDEPFFKISCSEQKIIKETILCENIDLICLKPNCIYKNQKYCCVKIFNESERNKRELIYHLLKNKWHNKQYHPIREGEIVKY